MSHKYDVCDSPEGEQMMFSLGGNEGTAASGEDAAGPNDEVQKDHNTTSDCQSKGGFEETASVMIEGTPEFAASEDAGAVLADVSYATEMARAMALIVEWRSGKATLNSLQLMQ